MFVMMVTMMKMLTFVASERIFMNSSCVTPQLCSSDWQKSVKYSCILSYTSPSNVWKQPPLSNFFIKMRKEYFRSTIGERSFQSAAASTSNAQPRSVRSSKSVLQFSSRLKTELFARSYQQSYWIRLCVTVTKHFCSVILKSLDLRHVNDDSNTN